MVTGRHVQEKTSWPMGVRIAPISMTDAVASGITRPVSGSFSCELMIFLHTGSITMAVVLPIPIPMKDNPDRPGPHPRFSEKTIGYATKQRYKIP